jgi:hypothetical protein
MAKLMDYGKKKPYREKRIYIHSPPRRRNPKQKTGFFATILIIAIAGVISSLIVHLWAVAAAIFFIVIIPTLLLFLLRRFTIKSIRWFFLNRDRIKPQEVMRNRRFRDSADAIITKALKNMDSLGHHFRDEQEANKELFVSLKALAGNMYIEYEPRYNGNNIGDIRIGDIVIEGKLDLDSKTETDRLIGQIQYCCSHTPYKMRIVIYGRIRPEAKARIKSSTYYPERVSLIYLSDPKRRRREYAPDF